MGGSASAPLLIAVGSAGLGLGILVGALAVWLYMSRPPRHGDFTDGSDDTTRKLALPWSSSRHRAPDPDPEPQPDPEPEPVDPAPSEPEASAAEPADPVSSDPPLPDPQAPPPTDELSDRQVAMIVSQVVAATEQAGAGEWTDAVLSGMPALGLTTFAPREMERFDPEQHEEGSPIRTAVGRRDGVIAQVVAPGLRMPAGTGVRRAKVRRYVRLPRPAPSPAAEMPPAAAARPTWDVETVQMRHDEFGTGSR